jgi:ABC-type Na+ efflux pump permease subunit
MTSPVWLIAEREFRTYAGTLSFWAALLFGSLAAGGGLMMLESIHRPSAPVSVRIVSPNTTRVRDIETALNEAGAVEGRRFKFDASGSTVTINSTTERDVNLGFGSGFPLSASGRSLVANILERDAARQAANAIPLTVHAVAAQDSARPGKEAALARFLLMLTLWLTLTGSLGMLLQAVVRERATRALESLLASAQAWQIMAGKLIGVGGISFLVLAAWLGSSVASSFAAPQSGLAPAIISELAAPVALLRAAVIYLLAYGFYGSITIALGAMARDSASAQNLSRPMFVVLVAAFFIALAVGMGSLSSPHWLLYIPAITPFVLLLTPPGAIPPALQLLTLGVMLIATCMIARIAATRFALKDNGPALLPRLNSSP